MQSTNSRKDDMPQTVLYTKSQLVREKYTPDGIQRLSMVIRATLHHCGISERALARQAEVSPKTLNKYVRGDIRRPQLDFLQALAPHLLKAIKVDSEVIEVEASKTYGSDWQTLDLLATSDYTPQSSERPRRRKDDFSQN
jgi:transcriptional regulator with XRE-family HTH domain